MANVTTISASKRDRAGKGAARAVRNAGLVPGVIYGDKQEPVLISVDPRIIMTEMHRIGFWTHVFNVDVEGDTHHALTRDVQFHPVTDVPIHIDFMRVGKNTMTKVMVPVIFINEATCPGLKKGGVLNVVRHEVEMMCNAASIPESLTIDLNNAKLGDSIHFSACEGAGTALPTITDRDFTIATIATPSGLKADSAADEDGAEGEGGEA